MKRGENSFSIPQIVGSAANFFSNWFGPGTSPTVKAVDEIDARRWDYPVGQNIMRGPRTEGMHTYEELRQMADGCEPARMVIETMKAAVSKASYNVVPRKIPGETNAQQQARGKGDGRILNIMKRLQFPEQDPQLPWQLWVNSLVEELLVIDAPTIYLRQTKGGKLFGLEQIDGSTIVKQIDARGRTPLGDKPAYQQYIKGVPAYEFTRAEMIYMPMNQRVHKLYGFSPTERFMLHCDILLWRNLSQLAMYNLSNIPLMFLKAPKDWKPSDIAAFQVWFDSVMTADLTERSKAVLIPDGADPIAPKKEALMDGADEMLYRIVCYNYGVSPNFFIKQQNRASSESYWDQADEEGLIPVLGQVKLLIDACIAHPQAFNSPDLEFEWTWQRKPKPLDQAQIFDIYAMHNILTTDEIREELGFDPMTDEQKTAIAATAPKQTLLPEGKKPLKQIGDGSEPNDNTIRKVLRSPKLRGY